MTVDLFSLSIDKLKILYNKTDDEVTKFLIQQVIRVKKYQHKYNYNMQKQNIKTKKINDLVDDLFEETIRPVEMWNKSCGKIDDKFVEEIQFDQANNKLMERMNFESTFRIEDNKKNNKKISSPFASDNIIDQQFLESDQYVNFKKFKKTNVIDNFTGYKMK